MRILGLLVCGLLLVACSGQAESPAKAEQGMMDMPVEMLMMNVYLTEWGIEFQQNPVPAGEMMFHLIGQGVAAHNFTLEGQGVSESVDVSPGEMKMLTVTLPAGEYRVHCNTDGHAEKGMDAILKVGE